MKRDLQKKNILTETKLIDAFHCRIIVKILRKRCYHNSISIRYYVNIIDFESHCALIRNLTSLGDKLTNAINKKNVFFILSSNQVMHDYLSQTFVILLSDK